MIISIITPTLNAEAYLVEALESVRRQEVNGFTIEHVVVDSGSCDATREIASRYDCRIIEVEHRGVFHAINEGTRQSRGDVIGFLGGDDTLLPGAMKAVADWYARRRSEWSIGAVRWTDGEGRSLGVVSPPPRWLTSAVFSSLEWSCICHQGAYQTRTLFDQLGGFDARHWYSSDHEYWARALLVMKPDCIPSVLATYRRHGGNLSMSGASAIQDEAEQTAETFAPRSALRRKLYRLALRVAVNGANPGWFLLKKAPSLRLLLPSTVK